MIVSIPTRAEALAAYKEASVAVEEAEKIRTRAADLLMSIPAAEEEPTRAEATAALDRLDARLRGTNVDDLVILRRALTGLIEPVVTHRFWRSRWDECDCIDPETAHEREDWYPLP